MKQLVLLALILLADGRNVYPCTVTVGSDGTRYYSDGCSEAPLPEHGTTDEASPS